MDYPKAEKMIQPRMTCKLFGALRVVLGIRDAVPLIHAPIGCGYHLRYIFGMRGNVPIRIYVTQMDQNDVIFGGERKLLTSLESLDKKLNPDLIVVFSSCASSIIGEDLEAISNQADVKCEILTISSGGFEGSQVDGYREALERIITKLIPDTDEKVNAFNIIGEFRGGEDLKYLKNMFNKLDLRLNSVLTASSSLKEIKRTLKANLNIPGCESAGIDACKLMEKRFGIRYLRLPMPIGIGQTLEFFEGIANALDKEINLENEKRSILEKLEKYKKNLAGKKVFIASGPTRALAYTRFLSELHMDPIIVSIDHSTETVERELKEINADILKEPDFEEFINVINKLDFDIMIGGMGEIGASTFIKKPLLDVMHGKKLTYGFEGALNIAREMAEALK